MIFKGLAQRFKYKSGMRALRNQLESPAAPTEGKKGVHSIGVIVDLDRFDDVECFQELAKDLGLAPNTVKVIGYRAAYDKNSPYATPVFSDKDLKWKGVIENGYVEEFLQKEYDLLVNYYDTDQLLMQLMTTKTKARIKVGFPRVNPALNDLMFEVDLNDFKLFKKELIKYLNVLNEIH